MISPESMHTLTPLLDKLDKQGATISIGSGSPLHSVTAVPIEKASIILSSVNTPVNGPIDPNTIVNALANATGDEGALYETHQVSLDNVVTDIVKIVRANMYLTRNIVLPIIDDLTNKLSDQYSNAQFAKTVNLNIVQSVQDSILSEELLQEFCNKNKGSTNYDAKIPRYHAQLSYEEIRALMKTGSDKFDKVIDKWIDIQSKQELIMDVFSDVFLISATQPKGLQRYCNIEKYEQTLIALLIAWGLSRNIQDGINAPLSNYEEDMAVLIRTLSAILAQAINKYNVGLKHKRVVSSYPPPGIHTSTTRRATENIYVHSAIYEEYLQSGGTPEGIMGAYLTDRKMFLTDLLEQHSQYVQVYRRTMNEVKLISNVQLMDMVRAFFVDNVRNVIDSITTHHKEEAISSFGYVTTKTENIKPVLHQFVRQISIADLNNIYDLVKRYVCKVYFCNTSVEELIDRINLIDPDGTGDINDVAVTASIDFIVDWFVSQVCIKRSS